MIDFAGERETARRRGEGGRGWRDKEMEENQLAPQPMVSTSFTAGEGDIDETCK